VIVREYTDNDLDRVVELHTRSGLKYPLPNMGDFFSRRVIEDKEGIGMVSLLKLTAEAYLICDPKWRTPAWRMEALKQIQEIANGDAVRKGVVEAVAFIPPSIEKTFKKRLKQTGWSKNKPSWHSYWKAVSYE
jgi:hypothetical protein